MAKEKKMDRRILKTRKILLDCLTDKMLEKDISQISVKELADAADINRGTFYLHYKDVYDMVDKIEADFMEEFQRIFDEEKNYEDCTPDSAMIDIMTYLEAHKKITAALLGPYGDLAFISAVKNFIKQHIQLFWKESDYSRENFDYYFSFIVSGCMGLIEAWIQNDFQRSKEDMAHLCAVMIYNGIQVFSKS